MLKYALRVLFCIAPPLYCVHGQILIDKSRIRNFWSSLPQDLDQKSGALSENRIPHPKCSFFCAVFSYTSRNGAALAARVLWGHKEESPHKKNVPHSGPKNFFESPFKAHLQALRGIWAIHFREPGPAPISPANGGMKGSLWYAGGLRKNLLLLHPDTFCWTGANLRVFFGHLSKKLIFENWFFQLFALQLIFKN